MIELEDEVTYTPFEIGSKRVSVNEDLITRDKIAEIAKKVVAVKRKHIKYLKECPFKEGESVEDWDVRTKDARAALEAEESKPRKGESLDAYLDRYMDPMPPNLAVYHDMLNLCLQEFGTKKNAEPLSDAEFGKLPLNKIIKFIKEVLGLARINVEAVFPGVRW